MKFEHSFVIHEGVQNAWEILNDVHRIAECMPGATVDSVVGDDVTGTCKIKLGPVAMNYRGKATFVKRDAEQRRIDLRGQAQDSSNGRASVDVVVTLAEQGTQTRVDVQTDLKVTGKPAQFGRGIMSDVSDRMIGQFASALSDMLDREQNAASRLESAAASPSAGGQSTQTDDAINLYPVVQKAILRVTLFTLAPAVVAAFIAWRRRPARGLRGDPSSRSATPRESVL